MAKSAHKAAVDASKVQDSRPTDPTSSPGLLPKTCGQTTFRQDSIAFLCRTPPPGRLCHNLEEPRLLPVRELRVTNFELVHQLVAQRLDIQWTGSLRRGCGGSAAATGQRLGRHLQHLVQQTQRVDADLVLDVILEDVHATAHRNLGLRWVCRRNVNPHAFEVQIRWRMARCVGGGRARKSTPPNKPLDLGTI